jgi:UDP-N-acetylmuramoyl-tripeptide--D-alanyl-D-alanine ligase
MWPADDIIRGTNGTPYRIERETFSAISTDSRTIGSGEFFIPLKGPNFDGHAFIGTAYAASDGGSLCDRDRKDVYENAKGTLVLVDDTNRALLDLAAFRRDRLPDTTFVAITGSNGKTTTKELLIHLVDGLFPVAYNEKNYNNQVGVATTMLAIEAAPRYAVFEMGTNHAGEIAVLTRMVRPQLSLITNVNASHLEGLSDLAGVREEKLSLFETTLDGGTLFVNADDPSLASWQPSGNRRRCSFGIDHHADYMLKVVEDKGLEGFAVELLFEGTTIATHTRLLGRHNLANVLAACVLAWAMGADADRLRSALPLFEPYKGRFNPIRSAKGYIVVDDAYNANPASMEWAVATIAAMPCSGKRIAVLGDMRELGAKTGEYHRELGRFLAGTNLAMILLTGRETKATAEAVGNGRARFFDDKKQLIDFVSANVGRDDIVLVKGSRAIGMDEIVEALI